MIKVNVETNCKLWEKKIKKPKIFFNKKLKDISSATKFLKNKNVTFTVFLTNSLNIKKLNKKFRKINKPTDVLSFPSFSTDDLKLIKKKDIYIGDIAISYEVVNSRIKKSNFITEFNKVWVHGLLHLIGYDHIKNKDFYRMSKLEKKFLDLV